MGTVWALYGHCTGIVWALGFPIALFMRSSFGVRKEADSKDLLLYSSVGLPSGGEGLLHCCVPGASVTGTLAPCAPNFNFTGDGEGSGANAASTLLARARERRRSHKAVMDRQGDDGSGPRPLPNQSVKRMRRSTSSLEAFQQRGEQAAGKPSAHTVPIQCPYSAHTVPIGKTHSAHIL